MKDNGVIGDVSCSVPFPLKNVKQNFSKQDISAL